MREEQKELEQNHLQLEVPGLPNLLGYSISNDGKIGEIMMTNGGMNLLHWQKKITSERNRMIFSLCMIYQVVQGLEKVHNFGYAHSDLKLENICARVASDGNL